MGIFVVALRYGLEWVYLRECYDTGYHRFDMVEDVKQAKRFSSVLDALGYGVHLIRSALTDDQPDELCIKRFDDV